MAKERKPRRKGKSKEGGRISRIGLGKGWQPYDGDQVARDTSERRHKTIRQTRKHSTSTDKPPPLDWLTPLGQPTPPRRVLNPLRSGIVQPLPPREPADQATFNAEVKEQVELRDTTDATVTRA